MRLLSKVVLYFIAIHQYKTEMSNIGYLPVYYTIFDL